MNLAGFKTLFNTRYWSLSNSFKTIEKELWIKEHKLGKYYLENKGKEEGLQFEKGENQQESKRERTAGMDYNVREPHGMIWYRSEPQEIMEKRGRNQRDQQRGVYGFTTKGKRIIVVFKGR